MHSHLGKESHVLTKGQKVMYALGDKLFVKEGPYIVNIPGGVPHSFTNLDSEVAELHVAPARDEHVGGRDVPVHEPHRPVLGVDRVVGVVERVSRLPHDRDRQRGLQRSPVVD